jgi:putative DNA primase/helicase
MVCGSLARPAVPDKFWDSDPELRDEAAPLRQHRRKQTQNAGMPNIIVRAGERHLAADDGIRALVNANAPFYQRDMTLVRVALVDAKNSNGETFQVPGIVPVTAAILERSLGQSARWLRLDGRSNKEVIIDPPRPVIQQILDMADELPFAPLTGIIQCPTLRRDGSLLHIEGYDEMTGLVLVNNLKMPPIRDKPTYADAEAALARLNELLIEFPFVDAASRTVALSMILTTVLRGAMDVAPMHLVTAPLPGTGKSYLADVASMVSTGDGCAVKAASPNPEETEKRLVSSALEGRPIVALDNCRNVLEGDFLCQITERPLLSLRALGSSDLHRTPNTFTLFANGNNVQVADDMVRRTMRSALDADCESPETRTYRHNPIKMIRANRGEYVVACLTIARAYIIAGCPNPCRHCQASNSGRPLCANHSSGSVAKTQ